MPKSVLIVEDDEACRWAVARLLRARGYDVSEVASGREGLERLRQQPLPDLVLLDWVLPDTEGWHFLQSLRQDPALATLPVVVLSGFAERAGQSSRLAGVPCLEKPVADSHLLATVEHLTTATWPEVLVVEDEGGVSGMLSLALRHYGLAVRPARGGHEAVDLFRRYRDKIALVLLDVQMPGLDGPATLRLLREIDPGVRCCFMSGNTGEYSAGELLAMGAAHVLQKPFANLAAVTQLLWDVIRAGPPQPPTPTG
jgi:CheY-like chemotaxis protein